MTSLMNACKKVKFILQDFFGDQESGLSTLEWILLVAAVGGLATIGIIVVRGSLSDSDDRVQSNAELTGVEGEIRTLQGGLDNIMQGIVQSGRGIKVNDAFRLKVCASPDAIPDKIPGTTPGTTVTLHRTLLGARDEMKELQSGYVGAFEFVPVRVATSDEPEFTDDLHQYIALSGSYQISWCRARSLATGQCGSIASEEPTDASVNTGYLDRSNMRVRGGSGTEFAPIPSIYRSSQDVCKGRV